MLSRAGLIMQRSPVASIIEGTRACRANTGACRTGRIFQLVFGPTPAQQRHRRFQLTPRKRGQFTPTAAWHINITKQKSDFCPTERERVLNTSVSSCYET